MSAQTAHTVLVVEDEVVLRRMICAALQMKGVRVLTAGNGFEALDKLAAQRVDLILTDWNMPGMNGGELIIQVLKQCRGDRPPIIVLSCDPDPGGSKVERAGIEVWLQKPCRISEMQNSVIDTINAARNRLTSWSADDSGPVAGHKRAACPGTVGG